MKTIKTSNYKKAMQQLNYQEVFNKCLETNGGDELEAAKSLLDLATGGVSSGWDEEKRQQKIQKILEMYARKPAILPNSI